MGGRHERTGIFVSRRKPRSEDTVQIGNLETVMVMSSDEKNLYIIKSSGSLPAPYIPVGWVCSRMGCEWYISSKDTNMVEAHSSYSEHVHFYRGDNGGIQLITDKKGDAEGRCVRAWRK